MCLWCKEGEMGVSDVVIHWTVYRRICCLCDGPSYCVPGLKMTLVWALLLALFNLLSSAKTPLAKPRDEWPFLSFQVLGALRDRLVKSCWNWCGFGREDGNLTDTIFKVPWPLKLGMLWREKWSWGPLKFFQSSSPLVTGGKKTLRVSDL